ncbi:MAG TPA: pseudouridine synthase [Dongiaceae bacterium]|nr:pseudouridine synthase [Dongiaceae bacterium]
MRLPPTEKIQVLLFNKPFQVLCQFTEHEGKTTLARFIEQDKIYPAGRLDFDSEGLLLLTGNGALQHLLTDPQHKLPKTYRVQVEGNISEDALNQLRSGVELKDGKTRPAIANRIEPPTDLWDRNPPIRFRAEIPTSWLELTITEGRNRQVRRMTAAVGFPTLRLVRVAIGPWNLEDLAPGESRWSSVPEAILAQLKPARPAEKNTPKTGKKRAFPNHQRSRAR